LQDAPPVAPAVRFVMRDKALTTLTFFKKYGVELGRRDRFKLRS
jgi:hypothetical protein